MALKSRFEDMDCKTLDDYCGDSEEMDHVLSADTDHIMLMDDIVGEADIPLRAAVDVDASSSSMKIAQPVARLGFGVGGCPPLKRNGNFAKPMAWLCKPSSQMTAVYRGNRS